MSNIPFTKMNGAGNDFVIFDVRHLFPNRDEDFIAALTEEKVRALCSRANPVTKGCDQLIVMQGDYANDTFMRIYNADGSESSACGNATRCVAWLLFEEKKGTLRHVNVRTLADTLHCDLTPEFHVRVNMGAPKLDWHDIPLRDAMDTLHMPYAHGPLTDPAAVNMGNPHVVFFVPEVEAVALSTLGPAIETDALFPKRVNVSVAHVVNRMEIRLRVWERGAGLTQACGTAACATLVAAARRGLTGHVADIALPGGELHVEWNEQTNHVFLTGPAELEFQGEIKI